MFQCLGQVDETASNSMIDLHDSIEDTDISIDSVHGECALVKLKNGGYAWGSQVNSLFYCVFWFYLFHWQMRDKKGLKFKLLFQSSDSRYTSITLYLSVIFYEDIFRLSLISLLISYLNWNYFMLNIMNL